MAESIEEKRAVYLAAREESEAAAAAVQREEDYFCRQLFTLRQSFSLEHADIIAREARARSALDRAEKDLWQAIFSS